MKRKGILLIVLALLLATAGVVYGHWTDTLEVEAYVETGNIMVHWKDVSTDDDGVPDGWEIIPDVGDPPGPGTPSGTMFDVWGIGSSDDPSAPEAATRYDKDVGRCIAWWDGDFFWLEALNTYPSYYCTTHSTFGNQGTVPVMLQTITIEVWRNGVDVTDLLVPYGGGVALPGVEFPYEITWDTVSGFGCGEQLDPGEDWWETTVNYFHVEQGAPMNSSYEMRQKLEFVNWNEYDPEIGAQCYFKADGSPLFVAP